MFRITQRVVTSRDIRAGLSEDGPKICDKGSTGTVISLENQEPDGVLVRLENGVEWWFKPNQLENLNE